MDHKTACGQSETLTLVFSLQLCAARAVAPTRVTILFVGVIACCVVLRADTPAVDNIRSRLLDPYRTVLDAYGRPSQKQDDILSADPFLFFAPSSDRQDRLSIREQWTGDRWDIGIKRLMSARRDGSERLSSWGAQ